MTKEHNFKNLTKCCMCDIDYWYFWSKNLSCEPYLCNGCHDFMQELRILMMLLLFLLKEVIIELILCI